MRRIFIAAIAALTLTSSAKGDFTRVVQTYVTNNEGKVEKNVNIEIDGRTFNTGEEGVAYLDVKPGCYTAAVYKDSCEQNDQEVLIKEGTVILVLKVYCLR